MSVILIENTSRHLVNVKLGHHGEKSVMRQLYLMNNLLAL